MPEEVEMLPSKGPKPPPKFSFRSTRLYIALLLMYGIFTGTSLRIDMSMGIVCMVNSSYSVEQKGITSLIAENSTSLEEYGKCGKVDLEQDAKSGYNGELEWDQKQIAGIFSASFYGMFISIWFSGYIADKYGPKFVFLAILFNAVLFTFLTPIIAKHSYWGILAVRFWMGVGEAFIMPCVTSVGSRWFPPTERSTFAAIYTSGNQMGAVITMLTSSYLCASGPFGGWPSIFYFFGSLGLGWIVCWLLFVSESPNSNRFISQEEKDYINEALGKTVHRKVCSLNLI